MTTTRFLKPLLLTMIISLWSATYSYGQACYGAGGCQDFSNFGFNSSTAATLEYDNYVSAFHQTVVRDLDGSLKIWGERTKADGTTSWLVPTPLNPGNYPGLTGTPLKIAIGSFGVTQPQFLLLTSDNKLWAWGKEGYLINDALTSSTAFQQLSLGLPTGVNAADVKMLFGTHESVILTTCAGAVYVLSNFSAMRGGTGNATTWTRVQKADGSFLSNIVAARGSAGSVIALDNNGALWTWGSSSWDGVNPGTSRNRATPLAAPTGATGRIKMVGATYSGYNAMSSYYLLYEDGNLYALGSNDYGQLGNWNTTNQNTWVQPRYSSAAGPVMNDIKWISPNEHDRGYAAINVINNSKVIYNWGCESGNMIGRGSNNSSPSVVNPGVPTNFQSGYANTNIISVETGGHTTMVLRECSSTFGYVGHRTEGSMGDNSISDSYDPTFSFQTNAIQVCGGQTVDGSLTASVNGPYCIGNSVQLIGMPAGGTYSIDAANSTATATLSGTSLTFNSTGTLRVSYTVTSGTCGTQVTYVKVFAVENCGAKVTIPGTIWNDADGNAVINSGEAGISNGLWANLTDPNDNVIASVRVNTDGTYSFQVGTGSIAASGNYSVVLTNSARQVGDPLATADTPTSGYGYTGVNRGGTTGVDNTNRTGKLNIGSLSGLSGGTTTAPVNFGISNDPSVLPVQFESLAATVRSGILFINWSTASEKNNKNFEIEASADGIHFTTIGTMDSKAVNGDSDSKLSYEFSVNLSGVAMATSGIAFILLAFGGLVWGLHRKQKTIFMALMAVAVISGAVACQKKGSDTLNSDKTAYIRIAQIDKDGGKSYSKIVKVVNH